MKEPQTSIITGILYFAFISITTIIAVELQGEPSSKKVRIDKPITVSIDDGTTMPFPSGRLIQLEAGTELVITTKTSNAIVSPRGRAITHRLGYINEGEQQIAVEVPNRRARKWH